MPTTTSQTLAARGLVPEQIASAEARVQSLGGSLDTSLLELDTLTEAQALELVVELSRLPKPSDELISQLSPAAAPLFPQALAERHGMAPLGLQRRQLQLLVRHPVDLAQVDEISFLLSRPLKLFVGTELQVAEALKIVYGIPIPPRLDALRRKLGPAIAPWSSAESRSGLARPVVIPDTRRSGPARPLILGASQGARPPPVPSTASTAPPAPAEIASPPPSSSPTLPLVSEAAQPVQAPEPSPPTEPLPQPQPDLHSQLQSEKTVIAALEPPTEPDSAVDQPIELPRKRLTSAVPVPVAPAESKAPIPMLTPVAAAVGEPTLVSVPALVVGQDAPAEPGAPERSSDGGAERSYWDSTAEVLSLKPRAPSSVALAAPLPAQEPLSEPSPFEAGPLEPAVVDTRPAASDEVPASRPERRFSAAEAMTALREEGTRDGVIGMAVRYLRGAFDFVAILVRKKDVFQIFEASGIDYEGGADLAQTVVDYERSRVLRTIVEGKAPYVGPVPAGDPLESALGAVGRYRLRAVLLYPIVIRDRTVAVVHGDRGGEALAPRQLSDVALVLSQLGAQLERVIREKRRKADGAPESPVAPPVSAPVVSEPAVSAVPSAPAEPVAVPPAEPTPVEPPGQDDALALQVAVDEEPFEVPIDWVDVDEGSSFAEQVRAFLSGAPPARAKAAEILRGGGADAAAAMAERFPGPLFVFRTNIDELPGPDGIGPLLGLMASIGTDAVSTLVELADAPGEERRFWATVLLAKIGDRRAIDVLGRRLLDNSPDIALAARRGLFRLRKEPEFSFVLQRVTGELTTTSNPERLTSVIRALGQFHHVAAIPRLIALVGIRDPQISHTAADALREVTRQNFGTAERRWSTWWNTAKEKPRLEWLIDALENRESDLRLAAISELTELAGLDFGYRSDVEPRGQEEAIGRWREWWEREGRHRPEAERVAIG